MAAPLEQAIARLSEPVTAAGDEMTQSVGPDQSSSEAASSPSPSKRPAARVLSAVPWLWSACLTWMAAVTGVKVLQLVTATTLGSALHSPSAAITRYQFVANRGVQGPATGTLQAPAGLALDSKGDLYMADSTGNRVEEFSPAGTLLRQWGRTGSAPGELRSPHGVAVDKQGNVYVVDTSNDPNQTFSSSEKALARWEPRGIRTEGSMGSGIWL